MLQKEKLVRLSIVKRAIKNEIHREKKHFFSVKIPSVVLVDFKHLVCALLETPGNKKEAGV